MIKEIEISIPQSYEDITLRKYLELQRELKNYEDDVEAQSAVLVTYLCGIDSKDLSGLGRADYVNISADISSWIGNTNYPLQQLIWIDGVEYGLEPNLSNMSYGAYADITQYDTITIDDNWAKIMSILYRPVTKKVRDTYEIERYTGSVDYNKFLDVTMDKHFGTLFFFVHLSTDLVKSILNSTKEAETNPNIKSILEKSGEIILQSWP